ncbi:MAG: pilus assembly PilX family protein, partial [Rubrobacteraceae bacterium]
MKRLLKNESGMSMALAVIMIALLGVMGAGLLGFAVTDLNQVVETNRGQKAFETAEAGIQAAKRRLLSGSCPESYDGAEAGVADPDNACADFEESDWSYAAVAGENDQPGKELEFEGDDITVKIRYLPFPGEEGCISGDTSDEGCAPEMPEGDDDQRRFFEVESLSETDSGGARRRIQAIYGTYDLGVPKAYFSLTDIDVNGNSCISNVSLFSLDDIDTGNSGAGSGCPGGGNVLQGEDLAYGDWQNEFNPTARGTTEAGIGTPESITGGSEVAGRDYDSGTGFVRDNPT